MEEGADFFNKLWRAPIEMICLENPRPNSHASKLLACRFSQVVNPNQFGDAATKATCLWLKSLPALMDTITVIPETVKSSTGRTWGKWFWQSSILKGEARAKFRSTTFPGIANAMADQWGTMTTMVAA
jgi:hypothetical protein